MTSVRPHALRGRCRSLPIRQAAVLAAARGRAHRGAGARRERTAARRRLRAGHPHRPARPPVRGGGRPRPRRRDARRGPPGRRRARDREHPLGARPAEDLPEAAPGPYRLVTFGQSFHWTDEERVAEAVYDMLEPGGALALVVHTVEGRPEPPSPGPPRIPHDGDRGAGREAPRAEAARRPGRRAVRTHRFEDVLVRTRFGAPRSDLRPRHPRPAARQRERVVGLLLDRPPRRRTCSATEPRTSPARCGSCWRRGRRRACSGTGPATPR